MTGLCTALSRSNALRLATLLGILSQDELFVRGSPALSLNRRQAPNNSDSDDDDDDDDDDDIDEDGEDGSASHHSTRTHTHSSTGSSTSVPAGAATSLPSGHSTSLPGGFPTASTGSLSTTPSTGWPNTQSSWSSGWTNPGSLPTNASGDTSSGSNAAIADTKGSFTGGSIAGIVIGSGVALVIAFFVTRCLKRRHSMAKRKQLERKEPLLGPPMLRSAHPTNAKDLSMTSANVASSHPSALYRSASRNTLPQIPFDTPAYMSTDNLASYTYAQMHAQRTPTVLSYDNPNDYADMTDSTTVRESEGGFGHASLHEDMLRRQKALEAHLDRMHENQSSPSEWNHSDVTINPPPRYQEH